ncbi:peptidase T [Sinorhizobium meliloti]|uniref:peptidase T n=1 Tax=Rhizobium meliloti TaxID=382 RepID=UPI000FD44D4F|nr:peptidase T [Sinorhizobium meliloti]MQV20542.1 peptidase T [Sinorhizobium meliloti]MQV32725.1 peptidase T [Sinorhizobium meliloti]RVE85630.1 peptidase T [Sinorhizobium meliloti]RVG49003.1 peptidase T [Sinorhizobium meliloti]RVM03853.1 peptidase T [Sinorhizobium meliloti]
MDAREQLISRFFRYAAIESQSNGRVQSLPSSQGQAAFAALLADEMRALGVDDVVIDEHAVVTGVKRGNGPEAPPIGFIAHLDTVDVGLSPFIRPQILRFEGKDLCLNTEADIWLRVAEHPELRSWVGEDIIVSDGTSVLGADNKAAIAVIMTLLGRLDQQQHGDIFVALVPDEEIGLRGAKELDLARFPCDFAYTIDCCELGEVVLETFNAASAEIVFTGVSAHPMSAKGTLVNPLSMAMDFISHFDREDTPERTADREGFFWFKDLVGNDSEATLTALIRDFDTNGFNRRKRKIAEVAERMRTQFPTGNIRYQITDTYRNIATSLARDDRAVALLFRAMDELGIEKKLIAMRGGTDGAVLSARGIPTPNFFTGAHNFHSRFEFLPVPAFEKSLDVALEICRLGASG